MKKTIILLFGLLVMLCTAQQSMAQQKATTSISTVTKKGETVRFTLTSSKPFLFASNRYVLHIGSKDFFQYQQGKKSGKAALTFLIPVGEFNSLAAGSGIYLTYGQVSTEQDMEELSKQSHRCWSLGKFNTTLLTK